MDKWNVGFASDTIWHDSDKDPPREYGEYIAIDENYSTDYIIYDPERIDTDSPWGQVFKIRSHNAWANEEVEVAAMWVPCRTKVIWWTYLP